MQSVIIYRNPAEAALWESGLVFPLMVGLVMAFLCAAAAAWAAGKCSLSGNKVAFVVVTAGIMGLMGTLWWMTTL